MKTCTKCDKSKDSSEFYKNKGSRGGYRSDCKKCVNAQRQEWAKAHPKPKPKFMLGPKAPTKTQWNFLAGLKYCSKCDTTKKLTDFHKDASRWSGVMSMCADCDSLKFAMRMSDPKNVARSKETSKAWYERTSTKEKRHESSQKVRASRIARTDDQREADFQRLRPEGKTCYTCSEVKPREAYHSKRDTADGCQDSCVDCKGIGWNNYRSPELFAYWESLELTDCTYCGGPFEHVDHIHAQKYGGTDDFYNLTPSCADCNSNKREMFVYDFINTLWNERGIEPWRAYRILHLQKQALTLAL